MLIRAAGMTGRVLSWLLVLGPGLVMPAGAGAQDTASTSVVPAPASQELQARIEELTLRMQGMEGKLRDSAAARKTADQARMEAERRLAEGSQEAARLGAEIALLRDAKVALEVRVEGAEARATQAAQAQADAQDAQRRLVTERDAEALRSVGLENQLDQLKRAQRSSEEACQERLRTLQAELAELRTSLVARESELARSRAELRTAEAERDALSRRLDAFRVLIPAPDGGSLLPDDARTRAADAAAALRDSRAHGDPARDARTRREILAGERSLQRRQVDVARVTAARGVYRIRPDDSLARIAGRYYGDSARWGEVHEANRHVLDDPDHLIPGMTLVIP